MKKNLIIRFKNTDKNLKFFLLKAQNEKFNTSLKVILNPRTSK